MASYFTPLSLSLRYQSYHKHFARPLTLGLMRRESNLNMNSFSPPLCCSSLWLQPFLLSGTITYIRISGSELIRTDRLTWIGMVNTPKWEVKGFGRFLQTPAVGKPNEFIRDRIKKVFKKKISFC